jgi:protein O-GlcNAc transferase
VKQLSSSFSAKLVYSMQRVIDISGEMVATTHDCCFESAMANFRQGKRSDAEKSCIDLLNSDSTHPGALHLLGVIRLLNGDTANAESLISQALAIRPDEVKETDLSLALRAQKRYSESEAALRRAVKINPNFSLAHYHLARLFDEQGDRISAEVSYRRAVECNPESGQFRFELGKLLANNGHLSDALTELLSAAEALPNSADIQNSLGIVLTESKQHDRAELAFRRAVDLRPNFAIGWNNLGNLLLTTGAGDISEALKCFRVAIGINPDFQAAHGNLAYALAFASDNGYEVLDACRRFANRFEAPFASQPVQYENDIKRGRRLRIGYVSPDFRFHCQAKFMLPLLRNHNHDVVEVYCYFTGGIADQITRQHVQYVDVWRDVFELDDDELAHQIRNDKIDVLVDLTMHMVNARRLVFARRPAPVQIAWLAYPGTTGSRTIGYRLTDPWLDPIETNLLDDRYSEKSIRLPDSFWCYEPLLQEINISAGPVENRGYITFGCLNNPCKLTDRTFALWARTMNCVEDSRLLLSTPEGNARVRILSKFSALGINSSRISFVSFQPPEQYMRTYQEIDIVLDTFPYNGHTTSLDAFWMGVPVITFTGSTPVSRAGYALLSNLQLQDLATNSEDDFIHAAVGLANNRSRLAALRLELRNRLIHSPLMDGGRFACSMESAFRQAWEDWCDKKGA